MSWTSPLSYLSILSLLDIITNAKQVAQLTPPAAPLQGKSKVPEEKKAVPVKADDQAKTSYEAAYDKEKKACRMKTLGSKATVYHTCLEEARRRLLNPPKPETPRTPLERELGRCQSLGKTIIVEQCKREAPEKVARALKEAAAAAERESKLTPEQKAAERLNRALSACAAQSKAVQINQCRVEAKKKYGNP